MKTSKADMTYSLADLLHLMRVLRTPEIGCPWDLKQTYQSITPSTIEEAYEVVDAIENGDLPQLKEELGDLLFQVVFYSQLGSEDGEFDFASVVDTVTTKLIARHPHVFANRNLHELVKEVGAEQQDGDIKRQWEEIKEQERLNKGLKGVLQDIPVGLPALSRAIKLQKRAARVGFDWPDVTAVLDKFKEETAEFEEALDAGDSAAIEEEVGDLLFTLSNLCRHLKIDPERAARSANSKFSARINYIERTIQSQGREFSDFDTDELDQLWEQAKSAL